MKSWIKKYEPSKIEGIIGQDDAVSQVVDFIKNFKEKKKKALLLHGPSGVGKTISVYAAANKLDLEVFEMNASDFRNKSGVEASLNPVLKQRSLFFRGRIILIDEIDGLSGTKDRGGLQAVAKLIVDSNFPIILTAANPYDNKFSSIRSKAALVQFDPLDYQDVFLILKNICEKESISYDETALKGLSRRCGGDARAAINDLQTLSQHNSSFSRSDLEELDSRNQLESMPQALIKVLKNKEASIALSAFDNVAEDIDQQFLWLDENLPKEYKNPKDLAKAYNYLSRADVFKGRIRRWQHWRFLSYINELITAGVSTAKSERSKEFVKYAPTNRILKIWQANMKYGKRKEISKKVALKTHTSSRRTLQDTIPFLKYMFKDKALAPRLTDEFSLDKDEADWLNSTSR